MTKLYSGKDVDKKALKKARIAILGYGSQGRAHALNLKDSGHDVVVGVRKNGASWKKAKKDGLKVAEPNDAAAGADLVAMLVPDLAQKDLYADVEKSLKKGATLLFAHGFNIHFKQIKPRKDLDVSLIAPKGPGDLVRRQYQQGRGVPSLIAVYQDATGKRIRERRSPTATASAVRAAAFSKRRSRKRPRRICSANRPCSAAAPAISCSRVSKRWSKPAISPKWPTTSACMS